jgi:hypothetical protein
MKRDFGVPPEKQLFWSEKPKAGRSGTDNISLYDTGMAQGMVVGAGIENLYTSCVLVKNRQKSGFVGRSSASSQCTASLSANLLVLVLVLEINKKQYGKPKAGRISSTGRPWALTKMVRGTVAAGEGSPLGRQLAEEVT